MRWFVTVQTALLIAAPALAAPLDSELHFLGKRDAVCSVDFRRLVDFDSCLPKKVAFTSVPPAVTKVALPVCSMSCIACYWLDPDECPFTGCLV